MTPRTRRITFAALALLGLSFAATTNANADGSDGPDTPYPPHSEDCEVGTDTDYPCMPPPDGPIIEPANCADGFPYATISIPDDGYGYQLDTQPVPPGVYEATPGTHHIAAYYGIKLITEWDITVTPDTCPTTTTTTTTPAPAPPTPRPATPAFLG